MKKLAIDWGALSLAFDDSFDMELALAQVDLPDWQKEDVKTADFVEQHYGSRVIAIPDTPSYEGYNEMQDFIATIEDDRLYNRLLNATQGRGAYGDGRGGLDASGNVRTQVKWTCPKL